jgi:hypothetical protein
MCCIYFLNILYRQAAWKVVTETYGRGEGMEHDPALYTRRITFIKVTFVPDNAALSNFEVMNFMLSLYDVTIYFSNFLFAE